MAMDNRLLRPTLVTTGGMTGAAAAFIPMNGAVWFDGGAPDEVFSRNLSGGTPTAIGSTILDAGEL